MELRMTQERIPARMKAQNGYSVRRWRCKNSLNIFSWCQLVTLLLEIWIKWLKPSSVSLGMSMPFPRILQILGDLSSQVTSGGPIFPALYLGMVSHLWPVWQAPSWSLQQQSYVISQNLYRGLSLKGQESPATSPSQNNTYNHVLHIPVLKGVFSQTMTGICVTGLATSRHILVSLHLAGSSVSFVLAIPPGLLRTPNSSHTFNQKMSVLLNPFSQTHPPGQCQPRCLVEQKGHPVFL